MTEGETITHNRTKRYLGVALDVTVDYVQLYKKQKLHLGTGKLKTAECSDLNLKDRNILKVYNPMTVPKLSLLKKCKGPLTHPQSNMVLLRHPVFLTERSSIEKVQGSTDPPLEQYNVTPTHPVVYVQPSIKYIPPVLK